MVTPRTQHTATLLLNGQVLVTDGFASGQGTGRAELYDPATGSWTATVRLSPKSSGHPATLLPNGQVLVSGGLSRQGVLVRAKLYKSAPEMLDVA